MKQLAARMLGATLRSSGRVGPDRQGEGDPGSLGEITRRRSTRDIGDGGWRDGSPVRPSWVPNDLYPFEDRWAEIDGNLVHYVDEGDGPPLLLLNGNPSWSFGWRDVILGLRDTFRCVAPDYPGFGLSRAAAGLRLPARVALDGRRALVDQLGLRWDVSSAMPGVARSASGWPVAGRSWSAGS